MLPETENTLKDPQAPDNPLKTPQSPKVSRLLPKFDAALEQLDKAKPFAKGNHQTQVHQIAEVLVGSQDGLESLYSRAARFDAAGVFTGGPWESPDKLQAPLVAGCLNGTGIYPVVEILSDLRMLAIAKGTLDYPGVTQQEADEFLQEVLALNLNFLFPTSSEQERIEAGPYRQAAERLLALIGKEIGLDHILDNVVYEVDHISIQRPIQIKRLKQIIEMASKIPPQPTQTEAREKLVFYQKALSGPSPKSQQHPDLSNYREILQECTPEEIQTEVESFATSLRQTGIAAPHHAVLLRFLRRKSPELLGTALGLSPLGMAELEQNSELINQLIKVAILPSTAQSIYGFSRILERSLLTRNEVAVGLRRLIDLDIEPTAKRNLMANRSSREGITANSVLLAGTLSVLGQPLGVGQGNNPTCQTARGISMWSQHAPAHLLDMIALAARDGIVEIPLEGVPINSKLLPPKDTSNLDLDLDAVSIVLIPHLDRIYDHMMTLTANRAEDGHKWVNPALYGHWVPTGFCAVFDKTGTHVVQYQDFVRRFLATHHPAYNDGYEMSYPNPLGICITSNHGNYLGAHAISLLRIKEYQGHLRAYFYNPNNEGRQNWGQDIQPAVTGHDEVEGESSLPLYQFVSRIYAFHYNPYEEGEGFAVPDHLIQEIETMARESWGRSFTWPS